ncbi:response regulator [Streptomyces polygonati]|uniref:Response regulator n=1 Tax=Streptomyces polygonati TaxID=1617087 RepID=A0ABV8HJR1_9ACTN
MTSSGPQPLARPIRVVIADDQAAVREGLALLLDTVPGLSVVGQAPDGLAAVAAVAETAPDVVLMDLNMPRCDGIEATARILAGHPGTRVVVLTTYADDDSILKALQAGALGYLTKDATRADIERAVKAAAAGQAVLDPAVQRRLLAAASAGAALSAPSSPSAAAEAPEVPAGAADGREELTAREAEVLKLIAGGLSNREIARALFIGDATVKTHINRVFTKTGSRDRAQAVHYAYTHGYADPHPTRAAD